MLEVKKKILFIIGVLDSGGVSKSLLSLLNVIDKKGYDVSLLTISGRGIFQNAIPDGVHVITDWRLEALMNRGKGVAMLIGKGEFALAFGSCVRLLLSVINKAWAGWWLSRLMPCVSDEEYDLIVDYNGQTQLYYMVDNLHGRKKITFFHSDYRKWRYYESMDRKYFAKVDGIYTISKICVEAMKEVFPEQAHKVGLMENISSPSLIRSMAEQPISDFEGTLKFLTLGHISKNKGTDLAIRAAAILRDRGICFRWFFLGKEVEDFRDLISQLGLEQHIVYLGMRANPYPYLKQADLYVHPSLYEGKSIALDEAKLLCKPIVVTDFSTVGDQFQDRVNASICKMEPSAIASAVEELLNDEHLRFRYVQHLQTHMADNTSEVQEIYELID